MHVTCDCQTSMTFFFLTHSFILDGFAPGMGLSKLTDEIFLYYMENFHLLISRYTLQVFIYIWITHV